ncbi:MAG: multiheme c-type cytochrome [bacterium]|nr:multiheme c-type cytochrome [bacterium]
MMKFSIILVCVVIGLGFSSPADADDSVVRGKCMTCHKEISPGLYNQWFGSRHAKHDVTCYDCHGAERGEADAYLHEGTYIATLVTPRDCGECHTQEMNEFVPAHRAKAGHILESADAYMAHAVAGDPAAVAGCESCHGSKIKIDPNSPNKLLRGKSWPNSGIGRINPDGTLGACNSCHLRHEFSRSQARQPETCGKCHLGPDHPQKEIYEESKHGIVYYTNLDKMNLDADRWVVGQDYYAAPTCATCHLSATRKQPVTHDAGERISWTLRPPVSKQQDNWEKKRANMQDVCSACHGPVWVKGHYEQFDGVVNLYNEKFAKPAGEVMTILKKNQTLKNPAEYSNDIEWIYWELWHHEGRRARHGASMMGPDYTWWHGLYEVGKHFYFEFLPAVRETGDAEAIAYIDQLMTEPFHRWMNQPTDEIKKQIRSGDMQKLYEHLYRTEPGTK